MRKYKIGESFTSNSGQVATVTEILKGRFIKITFCDTGYTYNISKAALQLGAFKDPLAKTIYGVGCTGFGEYSPSKNSRAFNVWHKMIERCYSETCKIRTPTYANCTVSIEWHNFQNFADWYVNHQGSSKSGYELDKDLLFTGNKLYSKETCTLIPKPLNIALQEKRSNCGKYPPGVYYKKQNNNFIAQLAYGDGVQKHLASCSTPEEARSIYLKAKKEHLKYLADHYSEQITYGAYTALMNWESAV